ncbi:MAG: bifunctional transcriptional regulator/O-phospho-L-serine synthase SbnI [Anaerolineales bacterium]
MNPKFPTLAILPVQSLIIHEHHDDSRTGPLVERIRGSGVFTNPVIVSPLHDHTARYMVLDGANRTTATRKMGFQHILAQVVEPDQLGVETHTWNHVIWDLPPEDLLSGIRDISGLTLHASTVEKAYDTVINKKTSLAALHLPDGQVYEIHIHQTSASERNRFMNAIMNSYIHRARMDRTAHRTVEPLLKIYPTLSGLVFTPKMPIAHLITLVSQGELVPAGVTRFTISPRALRVNFPLDILENPNLSLEEKNDALEEFVQKRFEKKGVRYYAEETVLYDE